MGNDELDEFESALEYEVLCSGCSTSRQGYEIHGNCDFCQNSVCDYCGMDESDLDAVLHGQCYELYKQKLLEDKET